MLTFSTNQRSERAMVSRSLQILENAPKYTMEGAHEYIIGKMIDSGEFNNTEPNRYNQKSRSANTYRSESFYGKETPVGEDSFILEQNTVVGVTEVDSFAELLDRVEVKNFVSSLLDYDGGIDYFFVEEGISIIRKLELIFFENQDTKGELSGYLQRYATYLSPDLDVNDMNKAILLEELQNKLQEVVSHGSLRLHTTV